MSLQKMFKTMMTILLVTIFSSIFLVTLLQVFFRYVLNAPLMWTEEVARYLFIWGVVLATGLGLQKGTHLGIDYFIDFLPKKIISIIKIISDVLIIGFSSVITVFGFDLLLKVSSNLTPALKISLGFVYAAIPIGGLLWIMYSIINLIHRFVNKNSSQ